MARHKLEQVPLVSADGTTQPPFPGGWVLAVVEGVRAFAPEYAAKHRLPGSRRTHDRIKAGESVKRSSYDEIESGLVALVTALFPTVSAINGFAVKYVNEYFRGWKAAAEIAPRWVSALGLQPGQTGVLARALLRDFVLRLFYLESCERALRGEAFSSVELELLRHDTPAQVYAALIRERARRGKVSMEELAEKLSLYDEKLRRLKAGKIVPDWRLLRKLSGANSNQRLLDGIGFIDVLLRKLGLNTGAMCAEILRVAEVFLPAHHRALVTWGKSEISDSVPDSRAAGKDWLAQFAAFGDNLLLHPGFQPVWPGLPDALWRAHLYTLQFARVVDLAQACFQFAEPENDRELTRWLDTAERKSEGCPYHWMKELQQHNNVLPFPPTTSV